MARSDSSSDESHKEKVRGDTFKSSSADTTETSSEVAEQVAVFDAKVFRSMARRREESIEMGRAFIGLKTLLGHGKWLRHFDETFVPLGITLRQAERYMKRAKKTDAESKNDKSSNLGTATDQGARDVKRADKQAEAEVDAHTDHGKPQKSDVVYELPLHLTADEAQAADELLKSPKWPSAEKRIAHRLRDSLFVKYGIREEQEEAD